MKRLPFFLMPLFILFAIGCKKTPEVRESDSIYVELDSIFEKEVDTVTPENDVQSVTEMPISQYRDTLEGIFDGKNKDLLISEPIIDSYEPIRKMNEKYYDVYSGWFYKWRVYTQKGTVKEKIIENTTGITFVTEGDVDGDGKDEWGYVSEWPTSFWMQYNLYHNDNGRWKLLIEPTSIWLPHIDPQDTLYGGHTAEDLIQKSNKPGYLKVKFSDVRNDGGDFLLIDTLIRIPR